MGDAAATAFGFLDPGWLWSQLSVGNPVRLMDVVVWFQAEKEEGE